MRQGTAYTWLAVAGLFGFGVAGGCGGSTSVGEFTGPVAGQPCGQPGTTSPASDGCNTCTCGSDSNWSCTKIACASDGGTGVGGNSSGAGGSSSSGVGGSTSGTGVGGGTPGPCKPGEMMTAPDGCNTCSCGSMGEWACTEKACLACKPGEMKTAADGCNTCTCSDTGAWGCTKKACPPVQCKEGDTMMSADGCNTCGCFGGQWACTQKACPPITCPAPVFPEGGACPAVVGWAQNPTTGQCCMYGTACTAPANWKMFTQESACQAASGKCPAPRAPGGMACDTVIVYAKDPTTGLCCQYGDACQSPLGWKFFTSSAECQKAGL